MARTSSAAVSPVADRAYVGISFVAGLLAVVGELFNVAVIAAVLAALVPVALVAAGVRLPLPAFAVLAIGPVVPVLAYTGIGSAIFLAIAAASRVASRTDGRLLVAGVTAAVVALPFVTFIPSVPGFEQDIGAVYFAFGGAFGVLVGVLLRRSTRLAEELRRADAELAKAGAREERHRIARDVHDLVAHSLTVVVLHVGGARRVLRSDPIAAEQALADAERVSRESLDAIRGAVGMLREDGEPQVPSLDLERLVTTYRSAGRPIILEIVGDPASLPLALRLTIYRAVQESLANSARHSPSDAPTQVDIAIGLVLVTTRIANRLHRSAGPSANRGGGFGLIGLREQIAALGGEMTDGPVGDDWVVEFRLPIEGAP